MSDLKSRFRREKSQTTFQKTLVRDDHLNGKSLFARINWLNCIIVFGVPLLALYGICTLKQFVWQTWIWAILYYFWTGFGITAGYHRLWSHVSYEASKPLQLFLMTGGSGALQGSIKWWCLLHRAHHRWTDTESDPYNSQRGFFYAHIGWLLLDNIHIDAHVHMTDLRSNAIVRWQHHHYAWFGPFMSLVFPTVVAYFCCNGDIRGGFYIAGALRLLFVHHATWCVNSVAHYFGAATFDDTISPRDHIVTGLLTLGEGYHNFHHEFPNDYRNGIHWYDYDPTKWFINASMRVGLASGLKRFPRNEIVKGELDMLEKWIAERKKGIVYAPNIDTLPVWSRQEAKVEMQQARKEKKVYIVVENVVHDVTQFVKENKHPGGKSIIVQRNGKDATKEFNGGIYNHTNAARNLMSHLRIARIVDA